MANALVIGATGHIGNALIRALAAAGHRVVGLARRPATNIEDLTDQIELHYADLNHLDVADAGLPRCDWLFHCAAPYLLDLTSGGQIEQHLAALRALALRFTPGEIDPAPRLIFISSFVIREQSALGHQLHPYFRLKRAMEALLLELKASHALDVVIVRPTALVGPYDCKPAAQSVMRQFLESPLPLAPRHPTNVIDSRDLAQALLLAAEQGESGATYLAAGHNIDFADAMNALRRLAGHPPLPIEPRIERWINTLSLLGVATEWLLMRSFRQNGLSPPTIAALLLGAAGHVSSDPFFVDRGFTTRPLLDSLRESVRWYRGVAKAREFSGERPLAPTFITH